MPWHGNRAMQTGGETTLGSSHGSVLGESIASAWQYKEIQSIRIAVYQCISGLVHHITCMAWQCRSLRC